MNDNRRRVLSGPCQDLNRNTSFSGRDQNRGKGVRVVNAVARPARLSASVSRDVPVPVADSSAIGPPGILNASSFNCSRCRRSPETPARTTLGPITYAPPRGPTLGFRTAVTAAGAGTRATLGYL